MENKIKSYVDGLFESAPKTKKVRDLKEEMICNLVEKYKDLIASGKLEQESYESVISSIGNPEEIAKIVMQDDVLQEKLNKQRRITALVVTTSVALYILATVAVIVCQGVAQLEDSLMAAVILVTYAIPTCILIYYFISRPKYIASDETMVENFKSYISDNNSKESIMKSISSIIYSIATVVFILYSFSTGGWAYSWVIYIIAGALVNIVKLNMSLKK